MQKINEKSASYAESDGVVAKRTRRPILDSAIGCFPARLKEAMAGTALKPFARKTGISEGSLHSYLNAETFPSLDRLDVIAAATGRDALWFLSGVPEGAVSQDLSARELTIALELAEEKLRIEELWLPKADFSALVLLILGKLRQGWAYNRIADHVALVLDRISKGAGDVGGRSAVDAASSEALGESRAKAVEERDE